MPNQQAAGLKLRQPALLNEPPGQRGYVPQLRVLNQVITDFPQAGFGQYARPLQGGKEV
ncbi:MAG: hypothetical protein JO114_12895 [Planctomycetaceae bacterium]|nr:hypothetical protein [Planctomycetaceae bacterium]MBV8310346.1 hypothetical protein [Planctomycetaceae bacterium]